jgi:cytochrome P450
VAPWLELVLEGLVVACGAWQVARIAARPSVRRELSEHPIAVAVAIVLALLALGLLAFVASRSAPLRRGTVALTAVAIALAAWRARPGYGARKGLAPGSLGLGASFDAIDERGFYLRQAARYGPVFKTSQFGTPVLCVVGLAAGRELIARHGERLEGATLPYTRLIPKGALRFMNAEDHRQVAGLFRASIAATDLESGEATARRAFRAELRRLAAESAARPGEGVPVGDAVARALFAALARILLGLDPERSEVTEIGSWMETLDFRRSRPGGKAWRRRIAAGLDAVTAILQGAQGDASAPIVPSSTLGRLLAAEPLALESRTLAGNLILILRMSHADLTGLLVWLFKMLSDHPAWVARMRTGPGTTAEARSGAVDLARRIVMETLRLEQSEYLYRRAAESFEFAGYRVPKGWLIRLCVQESHRSPEVFEHPTRFDPDRFERRSFSRSEYSPLGADAHGCMGVAMIHFLGRIFVEELTLGFDFEAVRDGPPERGTRHWHHWRPSRCFRVALLPRGGAGRAAAPAA